MTSAASKKRHHGGQLLLHNINALCERAVPLLVYIRSKAEAYIRFAERACSTCNKPRHNNPEVLAGPKESISTTVEHSIVVVCSRRVNMMLIHLNESERARAHDV